MSLALARQTLEGVRNLQSRESDWNAGAYGGYSLENPRTSWDRIFEVEPTYTGKAVTQLSAMQSMAVYACVRLISQTIAKIPLLTYAHTKEGKERDPQHYCWRLLQVAANPYQTAFRWKRMMQAWLCLWGNAYSEIEISGRGQVVGLWPWRPDRVQVWSGYMGNPPEIPSGPARDSGNGIFYTYTRNDGSMITLPAHRVLHLRGMELDGYMGLSPIACGRQSISLDQSALEYGARFFGNNGRPGGFISTPNRLGAEGRRNLRESFEDLHRGLRGAHRIGVLEEGLKYTDVGIPPEDMQFLQTRQFQAIDIARLYGVPPHKIAELSRATFSNIEEQKMEFIEDCIGDWMSNWEAEATTMLLSDREQANTLLEFFPEHLMRGNMLARYQAWAIGRNGGWLSQNDVRQKESMNKVDDPTMDTYITAPLNMQVGPSDPNDDPDEDPADDLDALSPEDASSLAQTMQAAIAKLAAAKKQKQLPAPEPEPDVQQQGA